MVKKHNPRKRKHAMNYNNSSIITGRSPLLRNMSPGHAELWFFGWTPVYYRQTYPLSPLPTISYAPLIIQNIQELSSSMKPYHSIVADLRPDHGTIIIRKRDNKKAYKIVQLFSDEQLQNITKKIIEYAPEKYTSKTYKEHTKMAYEKALETYDKHQRGKACNSCRPDSQRRCKKRKRCLN